MPAEFNDIVFIDGGIQQVGTAFIHNDNIDPSTDYDLVLETSALYATYVMIVVELTGVISDNTSAGGLNPGTDPVKQAWNFYTYVPIISSTNNTREAEPISLAAPYYFDGDQYVICEGFVASQQSLGLVVDVYAVAGNGYRYAVEINNAYLRAR